MSELTKEWLQQTIAELEEERDATSGAVNEDAAMALAAMKLALASLESGGEACEACGGNGSVDIDHGEMGIEHIECPKCYTSQPAPVSVPEWTNEQCLEFLSIAFRHAEIKGDLELDDIRLGVKMVNGSRAAMLQGAENVKSRCTIQTAPALDSSPKIAESRCSNSPVIQDDVRRMDWLVSKTVDVREPMFYGSHSLFWSQTITDEEDDYHATKLREQIDAAMEAEQAAAPKREA
ncbi:hypothetical protein [Enterobacter hormaechei]|uniref:hypothetical protein n=1 Tax=Enterobacter hormaechei TaxID=158836 RepID=UPI001E520904|nr:hypothetical protein [Enterobacter hormaechei]